MKELPGTPSDEHQGILSAGDTGVTTMFLSMAARHETSDAEFLRWHTFDHRPEQYRIQGLRSSLRLVSTPECRAARAASNSRYDVVDHIITYFFTDRAASDDGQPPLTTSLVEAGRFPEQLPPSVEQAFYTVVGRAAAPRIKAGADVLPWWPLRGAYVLIENGAHPTADLCEVPGVGGSWWATQDELQLDMTISVPVEERVQLTYLFLDEEPSVVAAQLRPVLTERWTKHSLEPLLAAPFHPVLGYEYDRHLP